MQLTCPKCQGAMRQYERNGVHVDQCTECRGIFLDRGELEKLIDAETSWNSSQAAQPAAAAPPPRAVRTRATSNSRTTNTVTRNTDTNNTATSRVTGSMATTKRSAGASW